MSDIPEKQSWLDLSIFSFLPALTGEMLIFALIILLAIISRLYDLGARVFSHDENTFISPGSIQSEKGINILH